MNTKTRLAYGLLGAPLAMAALPVYIYTPKLYGDEFGLGLALTGLILLGSRLIDTFQDPWLGRLADHLRQHPNGWSRLLGIATLCLSLAFFALFNPPAVSKPALMAWFSISLIIVYTAHSAISITYLAWGANASDDTHERTQIVASREGFGLSGVILASLLPTLLLSWLDINNSWLIFSLLFAFLLIVANWILHKQVPLPRQHQGERQGIFRPLQHPPFRRLITLFFLNGLAIAIAATLALFYISDVLNLSQYSGILLGLYFIAGAASLPLWLMLSRTFGKVSTWLLGSAVAILAFVWAVQLGNGDLLPYSIICILAGAALGADLAMPAAIAADLIPNEERHQTAGYFGIWSLINKAVLALAAGLALPLLALLGYQPGQGDQLTTLAIFYAGIPCLIKLLSATLLWHWRPSLEVQHVI